MVNFNNHVTFKSGNEVYQICRPFLETFQFKHFTFCRKYFNGSRAILTTTTETLYDLYLNKEYIFSKEYSQERNTLFDVLIGKNAGYYFQSEVIDHIPQKLFNLKKLSIQQAQYERKRQNIIDRFSLVIKNEQYYEFFIFFIAPNSVAKYLLINNLEVFHHFRLYFLDKAQKLIADAENNKFLQSLNLTYNNTVIIPNNMGKLLEEMKINRFYINGSKNYLTRQEMICATYLTHAYTAKQIAKTMHISPRTVETYIEKIREKFHSSDRSVLIEYLHNAFPSFFFSSTR
ncbi:MAG: helix-turn-helix transcriptional regulator [Proteobacteria bacterium]|nr:helix-turn-helix transcriptional regulator [Pseudomonadota bacterium]